MSHEPARVTPETFEFTDPKGLRVIIERYHETTTEPFTTVTSRIEPDRNPVVFVAPFSESPVSIRFGHTKLWITRKQARKLSELLVGAELSDPSGNIA